MDGGPVFRTMREQIADRIRGDVLSGRLEKGSSLREVLLAERYGVSRAPVRDALLQLTQEGLLVAKPNCGVSVGESANENLQPLVVKLRREIESMALKLAFDRFSEADFDALDASVAKLFEACTKRDLAKVVEYDMAFHRYIVNAADDTELVALWLPIVSRMLLHYSRHKNILESHAEHAEIAKAIRSKDLKQATKALINNIQ
ncbi:MAG: GntR family transcriptional regulator [Planctomycetota bacterium]